MSLAVQPIPDPGGDGLPPGSGFSRRRVLAVGAAGIGLALLGAFAGCGILQPRTRLDTVGTIDFRNPLAIPPLAEARRDGGTLVFPLTLTAGVSELVSAGPTTTWGVNGPLLGPTIRARRGDTVRMEVANELPEASTLHWHGMHLPASADGGPHQLVEPGTSWSPSWTIDQPAATLWYHPHPHGETEKQIYRGVAGLLILDDGEEDALPLPRRYGVDDVPLIVQDKTFDDKGQFAESTRTDPGLLGDTVLVNGTIAPVFEPTARLTRFRILNASTARSYSFGFSDDRSFAMIASDGGLLAAPVTLSRIRLTPGERAEIVVETAPGESVTLRSFPQDLGLATNATTDAGAADELDIMMLRAAAALTDSAELPARLAEVAAMDPREAATVRSFELRTDRINGQSMDMGRIDTTVAVDTTEVWELRNADTRPHNFHVHDVQFQIRHVGDQGPPPELAGWKDTVYLPPNTPIGVIMRFADYSDPAVPYMYHCHLLWHEDRGMMGQFVVVGPGGSAVTPQHAH